MALLKKIILSISTSFFLLGCVATTVPDSYSRINLREASTRQYRNNEKDVYRAALNVLQDFGYTIISTDSSAGAIKGEKEFIKPVTPEDILSLVLSQPYLPVNKTYSLRISVFVNEINSNETELRLHAEEITKRGTLLGGVSTASSSLNNPEIYNPVFAQIKFELERIQGIRFNDNSDE